MEWMLNVGGKVEVDLWLGKGMIVMICWFVGVVLLIVELSL